jgi:hypothetical protein
MQINLGQAEQIVRGVVGAGLILMTGAGAIVGLWKVAAVAMGAIGVFTASAGHCPVYRILGLGRPEQTRRPA